MKPDTLSDIFTTAIASFKRNKIRTVLTSLGITIGVMSVVLLIGLGVGLKNYLSDQFESLGSNLVIVFPGNVFSDEGGLGGGFGPGFAGGATFDEKDYDIIVKYDLPKKCVVSEALELAQEFRNFSTDRA